MRIALAFFMLSSAAYAQDAAWPEPVTTAFFSDADFTTLRPADDIAANWALLSEQDRQTVTQDCAALPDDAEQAMQLACGAIPAE